MKFRLSPIYYAFFAAMAVCVCALGAMGANPGQARRLLYLETGESAPVDVFNEPRLSSQLAFYDRSFGSTTLTMPPVVEATVDGGVVTAVSTVGNAAIPASGYVIAAEGKLGQWLTASLQPGKKVEIRVDPEALVRREAKRKADGANVPRKQDMLVIYTPNAMAKGPQTTQTSGPGAEAVVENGIIVAMGQNNKEIPAQGMVLSGLGSAAAWLTANAGIGMKAAVKDGTLTITAEPSRYVWIARQNLADFDRQAESARKTMGSRYPVQADERRVGAARLIDSAQADWLAGNAAQAVSKSLSACDILTGTRPLLLESRRVELRAVWHRPVEKTRQEIQQTVDRLASANINAVFLETFYTGKTIYPSALAEQWPEFAGSDPLSMWVSEAHQRGIEVHAWIHTLRFVDQSSLLKLHPDWASVKRRTTGVAGTEPGLDFADPGNPEVQNFVVQITSELAQGYDIDGIQLDYIRFGASAAPSPGYAYSDNIRQTFQQDYGVDPADITTKNASLWRSWSEWRQNQVTGLVRRIRQAVRALKPNMLLSAAVVGTLPSAKNDYLQDWPRWTDEGLVDFICPMLYHSEARWVESAAKNVLAQTGTKVFAFGGLGPFLGLEQSVVTEQALGLRRAGLQGAVLFALHSLGRGELQTFRNGLFREKAVPPYRFKEALPVAVDSLAREVSESYTRDGLLTSDAGKKLTQALAEVVTAAGDDYGKALPALIRLQNEYASVPSLASKIDDIVRLVMVNRQYVRNMTSARPL